MHSLQCPQLISQEVRRGQLFKTGPPEAVSLGLHTSALTSHWEWAALGEGRRCGFGGGGCLQLRAILERDSEAEAQRLWSDCENECLDLEAVAVGWQGVLRG